MLTLTSTARAQHHAPRISEQELAQDRNKRFAPAAAAPELPHIRAWDTLTTGQQLAIEDVIDELDTQAGTQDAGQRHLVSQYIALVAGITVTPGYEVAQCDFELGCGAVLDGFHAAGIQVSSGSFIVLCTDCTPAAAARYDD